jgi:hypothetical protein
VARRARYVGLALVGLLALAGCRSQGALEDPDGSPSVRTTVTVDDAQATYSPLLSTLAREISARSSSQAPRVEREVIYYDGDLGSCAYTGHLTFTDVVFGTDLSWDDVRAATQDTLTPSGFGLTGQLDIPGGYNGFDATAEDGGRVQVRSKSASPSTVTLTAPVVGVCSSEGTGQTLEPLDQ